jgi:rhamnosyltransferase
MGILRKLRKRIWGKNFPIERQSDRFPVESPNRSQICAAIVTYNVGVAIHRCIDSIQCQVDHVLIVDNASGETTRRELDKLAFTDSVTLILNERNEGIAHAFNQAVGWARDNGFQWILTLDHDSEATSGMVDELVRGFGALEKVGIINVGILSASPFDLNTQQYLYFPPRENGGLPVYEGEVISSGSLIWLGVFDVVGLFNEDLFIYFVDVDFCKRLICAGYGVYICPEAVFLHREGAKRRHKFLWIDSWYDHYGKTARYYISRNTIYVMKRLPLTRNDCWALLRRLWKDHVNILLFDKERLPVLWYSLRGLVDGIRFKVGSLDSRHSRSAD